MTGELISVVVPCYNAGSYLRGAIDSVLSQTYPRLELIIVDDGSTDESLSILKSYEGRIDVVRRARGGPARARNAGLQRASGEFVAFLDADDYWAPDCLERLHSRLHDSDAALSYCGWQNVGAAHKSNAPHVPPDYEAGDKVAAFLRAAAPWPIHAALTRRRVLEEVGGFDESLPGCEDYDLWLRIGSSRPIRRVESVLAFYRHHGEGQITSNEWRQAYHVLLIKSRFLSDHAALVAHIPREKRRSLIGGAFKRRGYDCYWRRDLVSARHIFRTALRRGFAGWRDIKYFAPSLLTERIYVKFVNALDRLH